MTKLHSPGQKHHTFSGKSYSQYGEEKILNDFFRGLKGGLVVDVGAADGIVNSNSRYLIESLKWAGILVEPHPTFFTLLQDLYSDNSDIQLINSAIYHTSGEAPFFLYGHDKHAQVSTLSETFKERVCAAHGDKFIKEPIVVKVQRLAEILPQDKQVDFLSIDCEGVDMEVLKSNDWSKNKPTMICVEHSMPKHELDQFMINNGYSLYQRTIGNSFFIASGEKHYE